MKIWKSLQSLENFEQISAHLILYDLAQKSLNKPQLCCIQNDLDVVIEKEFFELILPLSFQDVIQ